MPDNSSSLTFRIFKEGVFLREQTLHAAVIKIGKLSSSHLRLEDDSISRMHAVVEVSGSKVTIIDLGSTVGTFVNGAKVNKATLSNGDVLVMGGLRLELVVHTVAAMASPPPVPMAPQAAVPQAAVPQAAVPQAMPVFASSPPAPQVPGPTAIEVTSLLGDSVVGVKHVMNPRGGTTTNLTRGLFAGGAALLLISGIAFFSGVGAAADNKARMHEHVAAKKASHEFRPRHLSGAFDWMALGGLAGGLICMTAGLVRIREEKIQPSFRIGQASGVDLPTTNAPTDDFPLVAPDGDRFICNVSTSWTGHIAEGSQVTTFAELAAQGRATPSASIAGTLQLAIPNSGRIHVNTGAQNFSIHPVAQPRRQATALFGRTSSDLASYVGGSAVAVLGFVFLLGTLQPDEATLGGDSFASIGRMAHLQTTPTEDKIEEPEEDQSGDSSDGGGTGTKAALDEGAMGDTKSTNVSGQFSMKNKNVAPTMARAAATAHARQAGVLGLFASHELGFESLTATGTISSGLDDRDIYGGITGDKVGDMAGGFGNGINGVGPGGGGDGWGTVGAGNFNTIGHSEGTGNGYKPGKGKGNMRVHNSKTPLPKIGPSKQSGDLSPAIIRRYVQKKLKRIRYCYEKELVVKSNLSGTITTQFLISPTGSVQGVKATGMGDSKVESCVASAIESIQFPKPLDGGYVNVRSYPFTFQPAG